MEDFKHVLLALCPNSHRNPFDVQNIVEEKLRNLVKSNHQREHYSLPDLIIHVLYRKMEARCPTPLQN